MEVDNSSKAAGPQQQKKAKDALATCKYAKDMYERCFNRWYRYQFLRGNVYRECDEYFDEYRACLMEELHKIGLGNIEEFEDLQYGTVKVPQPPASSSPETNVKS
eukprot:GHVS01074319.1.p1 GENE.GHVS01074319.1~~GHVS01074319.1.p1  ORF type:complete len:105 (+),score=21.63 GHVS01074319.1:113-427(+)